jgi:hypothetical protein
MIFPETPTHTVHFVKLYLELKIKHTCRLSIPLSILIFGPCFRHTLECTKVEDTSTQLKQTTKQPCKQKVLVVKSSIFTLEKISLHKFGIEFNQKFNDYVSIRILVLYDVVRRRTTKSVPQPTRAEVDGLHMSQRGSNLRLSQLHPLRPSHADQ